LLEIYKDFFIHSKGESEKIHNSLIIRVNLCSFDEIFWSSQFVHVRFAPIVVPFLNLGLYDKTNMRRIFRMQLAVIVACATSASAVEFYVAPNGSDSATGTMEAPFATLERARDKVRAAVRGSEPAVVWLRGGNYVRTQTFALSSQDTNCIYQAVPGETPRLIGGKVLNTASFSTVTSGSPVWSRVATAARGNLLEVNLAAHGITNYGTLRRRGFGSSTTGAMELFVNGTPQVLGRWPNAGSWTTVASVVDTTTFTYSGTQPEGWTQAEEVWFLGYWGNYWADFSVQADAINTGTKRVTLKPPAVNYPILKGQPYYAFNLLEEIDTPGEYYINKATGMLYVWPPSGFSDAEIVVSVMETPLIQVDGARDVTVMGLEVLGARGNLARVNSGERVVFSQCRFSGSGADAVIIDGVNNGLHRCEVADAGSTAVRLNGGNRATLVGRGNFARHSRMHKFGRLTMTYASGAHLSGVGQILEHCELHDASHSALRFAGNNHRMEYNHIHDVCKWTSDAGAVYTGRDWGLQGNLLKFNFIHNIKTGFTSGTHGVHGIYLDDCASGISVFGNVLYNIEKRALFNAGGRDNIWENNVVAKCAEFHRSDTRGVTSINNTPGDSWNLLEKIAVFNYQNPPWSTAYPNLARTPNDYSQIGPFRYPVDTVFSRNVSWQNAANYVTSGGAMGYYAEVTDNLIGQNPLFVDEANLDLTLRADSPAFNIPGFQAIPFGEIGPQTTRVSNLPASDVTSTTLTMRGRLQHADEYSSYTVTVYWGEQDGGTNPAAWAHVNPVGIHANVAQADLSFHPGNVLSPNTTYYYAFRATNGTEDIWGVPTAMASTLGQPEVIHSGSSSVGTSSSSLRGVLTAGSAADVWICWGTTDGGTANTADWDNVVSIGAVSQGVEFASLVSGLSANTTYFYRCYATNAIGSAWSNAATFSAKPTGAWTPENLPGLSAWYDAADATTITASGGAVSQWNDKSGNGKHLTQATSTRRPATGTRTVNGLNVLDFDGGDVLLNASFAHSSLNVSYLQVFQSDRTGSGTGTFIGFGRATANDGYFRNESASDTLRGYGQRNPNQGEVYFNQDTNPHIVSYVKTGTSSQDAWQDGTKGAERTTAMTTFTSQRLSIGGKMDETAFVDGFVAETLFFASSLSADDREKLEGYLAHKWGLAANLPAGHPYKSGPPGGSGAITNLSPTGISASAATFNALLDASGTNYDVTVYYGTVDGGTNAASWGSSAAVGSWENVASTNISHAVSGLTAGQTYYYTFRASNTSGEVWASQSWMFKTSTAYSGIDAFGDWAGWDAAGGGDWEEITFTGDSNGDGVAEGMAWLLGANHPSANANSLLPQTAETNGNLVLTFKMLNPGKRGTAVLRLEHSRDLGVTDPWSENIITIPDANSTVDGVEFTITPLEGTDHNQVTAILPAAAANGTGKLFVRLSGVLSP
jgi:hypothetical protein